MNTTTMLSEAAIDQFAPCDRSGGDAPVLSARSISGRLAELGTSPESWDVRVAASVDSTNSVLMREVRTAAIGDGSGVETLARPVLLAAETQTAGRGRQGRPWQTVAGASLAASFRLKISAQSVSGLSLVAGLAVRSVLLPHGIACQLKWPNDVLVNGRKLAGILVEAHELVSRETSGGIVRSAIVVAGVGINLLPESHRALRADAQDRHFVAATDLLSELPGANTLSTDCNDLAAELAHELARSFERFENHGFAIFADEWNAADAYRGRPVEVIEAGQIVAGGISTGVDELGRMCLATAGGVRRIVSGDVALRLRAASTADGF